MCVCRTKCLGRAHMPRQARNRIGSRVIAPFFGGPPHFDTLKRRCPMAKSPLEGAVVDDAHVAEGGGGDCNGAHQRGAKEDQLT